MKLAIAMMLSFINQDGIPIVQFSMEPYPEINMKLYTSKGKRVKSFQTNHNMVQPLHKAFTCIIAAGKADKLRTFAGSYNVRTVTDSNKQSAHSYGLAIDLNADQYPYGSKPRQDKVLVQCFTEAGFSYGGNFLHTKDPHHFSLASWE